MNAVTQKAIARRSSKRQSVLFIGVILLLIIFVVRLFYIQTFAGPALAAEARGQRMVERDIPADRGEILDAKGSVLATTVDAYHLYVNQLQIPDFALYDDEGNLLGTGASAAAEVLAPILGENEFELGAELVGERGFKYLVKYLTPQQKRAIQELGIPGVGFERVPSRVYPADATAGNIIGFTGDEHFGLAGLEMVMEETLRGTDGKAVYERGRYGQRIPTTDQEIDEPVSGSDIMLTIDADLQFRTEKIIDEAVSKSGAEWGAVVVIDVRNGEIVTLADSNRVNPNNPGASSSQDRGSRAVSASFEPGSTAKAFTFAAAIDQGLTDPQKRYSVDDRITLNNETFRDSTDHPTLPLTATGILAESSNTGTLQIGKDIPASDYYDYLKKLGMGEPSGIELAGESGGVVHAVENWDNRTRYAVLFGQGFSTNLIQLTSAYAALGNDGVRHQPHLIRAVGDQASGLQPVSLDEPERVFKEETAKTLVQMLESTAAEGTGTGAAIEGYRVAGKTGTAQMPGPDGRLTRFVAGFTGLAPAEDPRYAVGVILYSPKSSIYGGVVAAPVFSQVMEAALVNAGVPRSTTEADLHPIRWE